jgi:uncharacterized protein YicC (UPF0701 family)
MATATTKAPARRAKKAAGKRADSTTLEYLQKAIEDMDHAREHAGKDVRAALDGVMEHVRGLVGDMRKRAENEATDWQHTLEHTTEEMRRELARRAVRAQQTPDALDELAAEITTRKAQLAQ